MEVKHVDNRKKVEILEAIDKDGKKEQITNNFKISALILLTGKQC